MNKKEKVVEPIISEEEKSKARDAMYAIYENINISFKNRCTISKQIDEIHNKKKIVGDDLRNLELYKLEKEREVNSEKKYWDLIDFIAKKFNIKYSKQYSYGGQLWISFV